MRYACCHLYVNFLSPADGESIVAKAKAARLGKTVCVANVDVTTCSKDGERTCATAVVTLRVVDRPSSPSDAAAS